MTERNHYAAALSALDRAYDCSSEDPLAAHFLATAQVHATLALADALRAPDVDLTVHVENAPEPQQDQPDFETTRCACKQLVPVGGGWCAACCHSADQHGPHNGPCSGVWHRQVS